MEGAAALLTRVSAPLTAIAVELSSLAVRHWRGFAPWVAFYFLLHALAEFALPTLVPGIYDALGNKARAGAPKAAAAGADRAALARTARTMIVATVMAVHVSAVSLYALLAYAPLAPLVEGLYATTPLTLHLVNVAIGFFIWDCFICVADGQSAVFVFHGIACLAIYVGALHPFLHHMACVTLLFEASTPFLHLRTVLINSGNTRGPLLPLASALFGGAFFASRIAHGYWAAFWWWWRMERSLTSGSAHSEPMYRMYQTLALALCILNAWWFSIIVRNAVTITVKKPKAG